jgi:hypothetical protein
VIDNFIKLYLLREKRGKGKRKREVYKGKGIEKGKGDRRYLCKYLSKEEIYD